MTALSTLGSGLSNATQTVQNAMVPATSVATTQSKLAPVTATTPLGSTLKTTPTAPTALATGLSNILGTGAGVTPDTLQTVAKTNPAPAAGSAAAVVQATNAAQSVSPSLTGINDNANVTQLQQQQATLNTAKANAQAAVTQYTTAQTQAATQVADLGSSVQSGYLGFPGPTAGSAPQVIVVGGGSSGGVSDTGITTIYQLQSNGTYKEITLDGSVASNQEYAQIMGTDQSDPTKLATTVFVKNPNAAQSVVAAYSAYGEATASLAAANTSLTNATNQLTTVTNQLTGAQTTLNTYNNTQASNANTTALGGSLSTIGQGISNAYGNDVNTGQQAQTSAMQAAGLGTVGNAGSALDAAAFGSANVSQTNQQGLATQQATLADQQATETASALQSSLATAQSQSGLQLQTMSQDLSEAITALQNDLQYATGVQQQAIQAYINSLQNQQATLSNSIGQSSLTNSEITSIATGVANGVSTAGSVYAAATKGSSTSTNTATS